MACSTCPRNDPKPDCNTCIPCAPCVSNAKICHKVAATVEEARQYPNSYVVITGDNNAVVHTDENGNPLTINRPDVFEPNHVPSVGAHIGNQVHDHINKITTVYDLAGNFYQLQGV